MTVSLEINSITAHYGTTKVLENLSLLVKAGELVSLLGASGCGKTTTLRLVAGFLTPTSGTIALGGKDLTRLPAYRRDIGLVFQNYALFPHLSVRDNVAFGLKQRGIAGVERSMKADDMLARVGLSALGGRFPSELSGGQKQRVALARALVSRPRFLALDEPLGALDALTRIGMQSLLERVWLAQGFTAVLVTHDVGEAIALADRVVMIEEGRVALDVAVDLPRPRRRGSAEAARLEAEILKHLVHEEPPDVGWVI